MKAAENITIVIHDKDKNLVSYKDGDSKAGLTFTVIKKGEEIPSNLLRNLVERNIEKIGDIIYKDKRPTNLPKDFNVESKTSTKMEIKKRKYSQNSLTKIYNDKGFSALKKIGEEFGVTDRSYRRLINEILTVQEERQRKGL